MKYYIIAGERSGDLHAGNLCGALTKAAPDISIRGVGGEQMAGAGVNLFMHYKAISFMGFAEVLLNLHKISRALTNVKKDLDAYAPDAVILVDFAGFNMKIARYAQRKGIKVFYYISPKVWAWNQKRAYKIKALVDHLFVILPFEKQFFEQFGYHNVDYVGNPLLDSIRSYKPTPDFRNRFSKDKPLVAVLAGSRQQEVSAMGNKLQAIAEKLPNVQFVVAAVDNLEDKHYQAFRGPNIQLLKNDTYNLLSVADASITTSGTATLETALFRCPQIVVYKTSSFTYMIAKSLIKIPFISLVNLISDKEIVKELIQKEFNTDRVIEELTKILPGGIQREKILKDYQELASLMGSPGASEKTAGLIVEYSKRKFYP